MPECNCAEDWRIEIMDLASGIVLRQIIPLSWSFDDTLNDLGPATVTLPLSKVSPRDVWPHFRAIAFTRLEGPRASKGTPRCEYIGMIETVSASARQNTVTIGMYSIESYLNHRRIGTTAAYTDIYQADFAADFVNSAAVNGINLVATGAATGVQRDWATDAANDQMVYDLITNLVQIENGIDYARSFAKIGNAWQTTLTFSDAPIGVGRGPLDGRRGLVDYSLNIEGSGHANRVVGRGDGISWDVNDLPDTIYAQFDKAVQWSDISNTEGVRLTDMTEGELARSKDPSAVPDVTTSKLSVAGAYDVGDTIDLTMNNGFIRFDGTARIINKAWSLEPESPTMCTFSFAPADDPLGSVLNVPASRKRRCC
jgi:hypothetical protein